MTLSLYADECVSAQIIAGARRRGTDIVTVQEEGLLGAVDAEHVERAKQLGRIILTEDYDFVADPGALERGLIFIKPTTTVGDAIRHIVELATLLDPIDMEHRIEWV